MNVKGIKYTLIIIIITTVLMATGCNVLDNGSEEADADYVLSGYYWMAGDEEGVDETSSGRAAINPLSFTTATNFSQLITEEEYAVFIPNYPEKGLKSYYTVRLEESGVSVSGYTGNDIYKISVKSEFPKKEDIFDYYLEEYYVLDAGDDDEWTVDDPIVANNSGTWESDSKAREKMELHYQDGSIRYEWIVSDGNDEKYAHFDIDGDMDMPDDTWSPALDNTMEWSSKVYYYQKIEEWVDYWYKESKEVFGVRYYTESKDASDKYFKTSYSLERIVTTETTFDQSGENFLSLLFDQIFGTSYTQGSETETLSETVIRDQITANNKKTTKVNSYIVPTFGDAFNIELYSEYDL